MPTYCQAGNTARVTFPDGSVMDFTDTPITINVTDETVRYKLVVNYSLEYNGATYYTGQISLVVVAPPQPEGPYKKNRYQLMVRALRWVGDSFEERFLAGWISPPMTPYSVTLINYEYVPWHLTLNQPATPPINKYKISVFGDGGNKLFEKKYETNNYLVECIGCPPRTLDCGDCCLPCDATFNSISSIRAMIQKILRNVPV